MSEATTQSSPFDPIIARCPIVVKVYVQELVDIYNQIYIPCEMVSSELLKHHDSTILDEDATVHAQTALTEVIFLRLNLTRLIEPYPEIFQENWNEKKIQEELLSWMADDEKDAILAAEITSTVLRKIRVVVDKSRAFIDWERYLDNVVKNPRSRILDDMSMSSSIDSSIASLEKMASTAAITWFYGLTGIHDKIDYLTRQIAHCLEKHREHKDNLVRSKQAAEKAYDCIQELKNRFANLILPPYDQVLKGKWDPHKVQRIIIDMQDDSTKNDALAWQLATGPVFGIRDAVDHAREQIAEEQSLKAKIEDLEKKILSLQVDTDF